MFNSKKEQIEADTAVCARADQCCGARYLGEHHRVHPSGALLPVEASVSQHSAQQVCSHTLPARGTEEPPAIQP